MRSFQVFFSMFAKGWLTYNLYFQIMRKSKSLSQKYNIVRNRKFSHNLSMVMWDCDGSYFFYHYRHKKVIIGSWWGYDCQHLVIIVMRRSWWSWWYNGGQFFFINIMRRSCDGLDEVMLVYQLFYGIVRQKLSSMIILCSFILDY